MRATFAPIAFPFSSSGRGISWKLAGSGIATMSDSSIALNPVIDEPSKPMPSFSASSISAGVIANDFRCPSRSVNQKRTCSQPSSLIRFSTARREAGVDVARSLLLTIVERAVPVLRVVVRCVLGRAISSSSKWKSPGREPRPRPRRLTKTATLYKASAGWGSGSVARPWWRSARP